MPSSWTPNPCSHGSVSAVSQTPTDHFRGKVSFFFLKVCLHYQSWLWMQQFCVPAGLGQHGGPHWWLSPWLLKSWLNEEASLRVGWAPGLSPYLYLPVAAYHQFICHADMAVTQQKGKRAISSLLEQFASSPLFCCPGWFLFKWGDPSFYFKLC